MEVDRNSIYDGRRPCQIFHPTGVPTRVDCLDRRHAREREQVRHPAGLDLRLHFIRDVGRVQVEFLEDFLG